ncbi:MAG: hypothetical protein J6386_24825 [Candidatus Synoicihabitans palmerolidicus]|nr:hypothetical protein [Candidatus Synoicihabitans palmerolidicus]
MAVSAQTTSRATAVHVQPDEASAVLKLVKPGEDLPEAAPAMPAPSGWSAVALAGPHEVFVENRFIGKDLDVKPGSPLHLKPKSDSPVLTSSTATDEIEITGLRGRWTQLRVNKRVVAYVLGSLSSSISPPVPAVTTATVKDTPISQSPNPQPVNARPGPGRQIERTEAERTSLAALPRLFEGKLASTRSPLRPRRPYDFALESEDGIRFAYVDLTKLLLTEQIEKYLERTVVVYGVARPVPQTKDIVISVESLQLR